MNFAWSEKQEFKFKSETLLSKSFLVDLDGILKESVPLAVLSFSSFPWKLKQNFPRSYGHRVQASSLCCHQENILQK